MSTPIDLGQPAPEPFSQYVQFNWGNISRDERGWYILADASRTLKMLRHDGWNAKLIDSQLQEDDTVRVYLEVEGADDAMPCLASTQPSGNSGQFPTIKPH
jgi:hypothetical protein